MREREEREREEREREERERGERERRERSERGDAGIKSKISFGCLSESRLHVLLNLE